MEIKITGNNIDITDSLKILIHDKFKKISRHFDKIDDVKFILKTEKNNHIAESKLHLLHNEIYCEASGSDMYSVIDQLINKIDRKVIKLKEKAKDHRQLKGVERKHNT
jgi:putative sigma-54 modulation protein